MGLQKLGCNFWQEWFKKQKYRQKLIPNTQFQPCKVFVQNDLVERKIKNQRASSNFFLKFKEKLGLDPNKYSFDEEDITRALQIAFEGEIMHIQYWVQNKRLHGYFPKHKLGIEIMNIVLWIEILKTNQVDN